MDINQLTQRALHIRQQFAELEKKQHGTEWTPLNITDGFIVDVGELMKLVMAKEGLRNVDNVDSKLAHELADCLWSILILADKYGVNLERSFLKTMDDLETEISRKI